MAGVRVTEEELRRMQERVAKGVEQAIAPLRPTLPTSLVATGHPVSVNMGKAAVLVNGRPRIVKTDQAREWASMMVAQFSRQWGVLMPIECEITVSVQVFVSANTMDVDNPLKPILDALQAAGVVKNDRLVRTASITKHVDRHRPRVEVSIMESPLKTL
jgi:Holliday junction resolvase RusA-like endonuclease